MAQRTSKRIRALAKRTPGKNARSADRVLQTARDQFGFDSLRPGQREAIDALLAGEDSLIVMPTGSGKSAIYQIAGSLLEGATLVVSPLIALQKDQVDSINERTGEEAEAVVVNSTLRASEAREVAEKIVEGESKFIFLAPEQLRKLETIEMLEAAKIALFVVDEAHCISEWGHDFRPDYLELGSVIEKLGHPVVLAMTATASAVVRDEIVERLCLRSPKILVGGFDRPNIYLRVDHFEKKEEKLEKLIQRLTWAEKPGLVYVATRKNAEEIMCLLAEAGVNALFYHGGLKASERHSIQEQFMAGEAEVVVATNAFGMGIDKADVRFVYHFDISDSLDSYYQEIGRAGRDGEKAEAVLFFRQEDMGIQKFHSAQGKLHAQEVEKVVNTIADQQHPVEVEDIAQELDLSDHKLARVVHRLEDVGAVETLPTGELQFAEEASVAEAAQAAVEEQERRQKGKQERLRLMQEYADTGTCRRELLLRYFGDPFTGSCGSCDNCEAAAPGIRVDPSVGTRREVA